jgi:hypothetical protein
LQGLSGMKNFSPASLAFLRGMFGGSDISI